MLSRLARLARASPSARLGGGGTCAFRPPVPQAAPARLLSKAPSFPKEGTAARLRWLLREYGALGACTHFSIYFATLGGLFLGVDNEVFLAGDALTMLRSIGVDRIVDLDHLNPTASNFAVAWILAKFTEPVRLPITFWLTPRVAAFVRRSGLR